MIKQHINWRSFATPSIYYKDVDIQNKTRVYPIHENENITRDLLNKEMRNNKGVYGRSHPNC